MSAFYPTNSTLNKFLRTCFLFLCTLYSFSKGNTQTRTASGGVQGSISIQIRDEKWFETSSNEIDTVKNNVRTFDIKKTGTDKVLLSWDGRSETNLNYYMIERSRDGVNYEGKAIFFGNLYSDSNQHYSFIDKGLAKGSYFYRLKVVNNDGSYRLCATNTVSFDDEREQRQLATFPNPSSNEIKVLIPDSWVQEKVTFEFYNVSGQLSGKQTINSAAKSEILNITTLATGAYVVKAFTPAKSAAVGRIIKR